MADSPMITAFAESAFSKYQHALVTYLTMDEPTDNTLTDLNSEGVC